MKILLVDDAPAMRDILKKILAHLPGATFVEAADGVQACAALASSGGAVDLCLVDWNMPNMDGLAFVRLVRAVNRSMPIIMVATEAEKARVVEAIKAGVNNYVCKPYTPKILIEKVTQTLARQKAAA
ncbi:MAG: response regulator [Phycisphaerae bacterium]|nr:response regulator [Tepidisphaeraceae bacterium]